MEFLLYSWLEYEYPRLHGIRSYFNKMMKSLCYEDGVVNRSVFDAPDLPEEMLTVPPLNESSHRRRLFSIWR